MGVRLLPQDTNRVDDVVFDHLKRSRWEAGAAILNGVLNESIVHRDERMNALALWRLLRWRLAFDAGWLIQFDPPSQGYGRL